MSAWLITWHTLLYHIWGTHAVTAFLSNSFLHSFLPFPHQFFTILVFFKYTRSINSIQVAACSDFNVAFCCFIYMTQQDTNFQKLTIMCYKVLNRQNKCKACGFSQILAFSLVCVHLNVCGGCKSS